MSDLVDRFARIVGGTWPFWRNSTGTRALPTWRLGTVVTAPAAGAALVTVAAGGAGIIHRCFGWSIGKEDLIGNLGQIRDGAAVRLGMSFGSSMGVLEWSPIPIVIGTANTAMTLNNLNAGAAGIDYWAGVLVESA